MQAGRKAVWSIPYVVFVAFFPSLKQNFIAYRSSKLSSHADCVFYIHQLWQSGFSRVYSNWCCSCSFEPEIIKLSQSSYKMYSNNMMNFQESTTIFKCLSKKKKKSGNSLKAPRKWVVKYLALILENNYLCSFFFLDFERINERILFPCVCERRWGCVLI